MKREHINTVGPSNGRRQVESAALAESTASSESFVTNCRWTQQPASGLAAGREFTLLHCVNEFRIGAGGDEKDMPSRVFAVAQASPVTEPSNLNAIPDIAV